VAVIMDGKALASRMEAGFKEAATALGGTLGRAPALHVVLCGDDPASAVYVGGKERACGRIGITSTVHRPPASSTTEDLLSLVRRLNDDSDVDAVLVQLPLPEQVDARLVLEAVAPQKDVDGFHPVNAGLLAQGRPATVPCTPLGCMELLREYSIPVAGSRAVVIGRSNIVGRPMAALLLQANATVTVCHSKTADMAELCREADILIAATGRAEMVGAAFVKPGACVIDVGMVRTEQGLRGDVLRAEVEPIAGWLTPVPGGVGPMTIAMLMSNTLQLAGRRQGSAIAVP
jgi:methylenetetrahydrofolate dehydrogenase (NADP+)/methenyltetrahydrofolate cyclohydrolase